MIRHIVGIMAFLFIVGFAVWLYSEEQAAKPGSLSSAHEMFEDCQNCHVPWKGVDEQMCLQCHVFSDAKELKPQLRFHEAEKHCLECHTEHQGVGADIVQMDHTLLSGELKCFQCHVDPHDSKFGNDCLECHRIGEWGIEGFRHPPDDNRNCQRCHQAPDSHYHEQFWKEIQEGHTEWRLEGTLPPREECWQCHITHRWDHLRMPHNL
ncbi:MAG: hypothetical protein R6U22_03320 [Desulfohalobiaceae bacterium]